MELSYYMQYGSQKVVHDTLQMARPAQRDRKIFSPCYVLQ
jgi:hypothetical protein